MARLDDEDRRDAAGVGPYAHSIQGLRPLRDLDGWDITDGSADIRGWQVVTLGGRELGRVEDLLVDTEENEVVMFTIDLKDSDRTANAPLRTAQIERDQHLVRIDSAELQGVVPTDVVIDRDRDRTLAAGAATAGAAGAAEVARERATEHDAERAAAERAASERAAAERERERAARAASGDRQESLLDRIKVHHREKEVEKHAERDADRAAADAPVERVVERRPVVVEEVVVRRRTIDPESPEARDDAQRAAERDAELRHEKPGETF